MAPKRPDIFMNICEPTRGAPSSSDPRTLTTELMSSIPSDLFTRCEEEELALLQEPNPYRPEEPGHTTTSLLNILTMNLGLLSLTLEEPNQEPIPDTDEEMADHRQPPQGQLPQTKDKELSLAKPEPFNGDRTKIEKFLLDCQIYLLINEDVYHEDKKRVGFVLSLMSKGEAAEWKEQYLKSILDPTSYAINLPTYPEFTIRVRADFKQEDQIGDTVAKLKDLKQGKDQSIEGLVTEFRLLVRQAGLGSTTTSDQIHLIEMFKDTLNSHIAAKILFSDNCKGTSLVPYFLFCFFYSFEPDPWLLLI